MSATITKHNLCINAVQPSHIQDFLFLALIYIYDFHSISSLKVGPYLHPSTSHATCILTVWVFIRQPVVLVGVDLRVKRPSVALLFPRVTVNILTLVGVAHLELGIRPHALPASIVWSGRVAGSERTGIFLSYFSPLKPEAVTNHLY